MLDWFRMVSSFPGSTHAPQVIRQFYKLYRGYARAVEAAAAGGPPANFSEHLDGTTIERVIPYSPAARRIVEGIRNGQRLDGQNTTRDWAEEVCSCLCETSGLL